MAPGAVIHDSKSVTIRFEVSLAPLGYGRHVVLRPVSISFGSNMAPGAMDDTHTHSTRSVPISFENNRAPEARAVTHL